MIRKIYIRGPRQQRAIAALLANVISVKDLGPLIGALNPRQVISELRGQGFEGIIKTRRFTIIDQDGRRCRPGEYYIPQDVKPMVEKVLREYIVQAHARRTKQTDRADGANNSRRE